jgi:hypothetical protein
MGQKKTTSQEEIHRPPLLMEFFLRDEAISSCQSVSIACLLPLLTIFQDE